MTKGQLQRFQHGNLSSKGTVLLVKHAKHKGTHYLFVLFVTCVRFSSLVDLVGSIYFTVLNCPEVTSKLAKYDEHVGLARMEGKVC